jgi:uncharacterized protein YcfL
MKSALLLLALLALAGCASPASQSAQPASAGGNALPSPEPAIPQRPAGPAPAAGKSPDKRVTVDPALNGILQIKQVRVIKETEGYLEFQVDVQNLGASAITVIYQVDWLDQDGVSLGISMEQPPCFLFAHETHPITIATPAFSARDFRMTFRPRVR